MILSMWFDFWIWSNAWVQNNKLAVLLGVAWGLIAGYYVVRWVINFLYEPLIPDPISPCPKIPTPPTDLSAEISLQTTVDSPSVVLPPPYRPFVSVPPDTGHLLDRMNDAVHRVPFVQQVPVSPTPKKPKVRGVEKVKSPCDIVQENGKIKAMVFTGHLSCHVFQDPESQSVGTGLLVDDRFVGRDLLWLKGALDAAEVGDNINLGQVRLTVEVLDDSSAK